MTEPTGILFNIQRFSLHDGPGIRTTLFLKGCPLRCFWCHNPEGLHPKPEVQFFSSRCIGCGECVRVCPEDAQSLGAEGERTYTRERCLVCGACVESCFAEGLRMTGREVSVSEALHEALADRAFFETSGGGVTLSGGEPLLQPAFSLALLRACHEAGLHTAVETTAYCAWEHLEALLPYTDLFLVDLKHRDPEKHRAATGVSNERILDNARRLALTCKPILFRVPVVPGVNDTPDDIGAIAAFVKSLTGLCGGGEANLSLELLAFHHLAEDKYRSLGMQYRAGELTPPTPEALAALADTARACGVTVRNPA